MIRRVEIDMLAGENQGRPRVASNEGSGDTNAQVRITFDDKESAIAYAERHGLDYHLIPAPPVTLKIQAYADNFR